MRKLISTMGNMILVPAIVEPLGKHWQQPDRSELLIDDKSAIMAQDAFDKLAEYSATFPTGVYVGKMWKAQDKEGWWLMWFDQAKDPTKCTIEYRKIILL